MKLGLVAGYSPAHMSVPMDLILEAERLGFGFGVDLRGVGFGRGDPGGLDPGPHFADQRRDGHHPDGGPDPRLRRDDRHDPGRDVGRAVHARGGAKRPPGHRGMARRPLRPSPRRTREYVSIIRKILAREAPLTHEEVRTIGSPTAGRGRQDSASRSRASCTAIRRCGIFTGAFTENGVRTSAEIADGVFPVWMNPERFDLFATALDEDSRGRGTARASTPSRSPPFVDVVLDDDLDRARGQVREHLALYIGGMGARSKNFYNDYAKRLGHEAAAVRDPGSLPRRAPAGGGRPRFRTRSWTRVALVGPADRIRERLQIWREAGAKRHVGSILARHSSVEAVRLLAEELL